MTFPYTTPEGKQSKALVKLGQDTFMPNYKPREMILDKGEGSRVWDLDGNEYIDFSTGIAVNSLGHRDPDLLKALNEQAMKIWHTSNVFFTEPSIRLAEAMVENVDFCERVYFCNSGGEANEAGIKLIRKWATGEGRDPEHREILTVTGSFHGRTMATVTATAQPKYHEGFEPLPGGFKYCDGFNNIDAIKEAVSDKTCAIMIEPIQGEGGIVPMEEGFLKALHNLCDEKDMLLFLDEIQCGMGRTGKLYAYMHEEGVEPDLLSTAKALGCGIPVGALLAGKKTAEVLQFGSHGSTFGGNPLMCAVALAAFTKINDERLMKHVERMSKNFMGSLAQLNQEFNLFTEIRGKGLMIGAELNDAWKGRAGELAEVARKYGVLMLVAGPNVARFLPPLTLNDEDLQEGMERLTKAFESVA